MLQASFAQPAPHYATALVVDRRLGGVEASARVDDSARLRYKRAVLVRSDGAEGMEGVALVEGRQDQDVSVAEVQKVRALPHRAGLEGFGLGLVTDEERPQILPVYEVIGPVEEDRSPHVLYARPDELIPDAVLVPDGMVAEPD